jgi:hypothetical protein
LMALASSSQSQAAQVFAVMGSISLKIRHPGGDREPLPRVRPLSKSLVTYAGMVSADGPSAGTPRECGHRPGEKPR